METGIAATEIKTRLTIHSCVIGFVSGCGSYSGHGPVEQNHRARALRPARPQQPGRGCHDSNSTNWTSLRNAVTATGRRLASPTPSQTARTGFTRWRSCQEDSKAWLKRLGIVAAWGHAAYRALQGGRAHAATPVSVACAIKHEQVKLTSMKTQLAALHKGSRICAIPEPVPGRKPVLALLMRLLWVVALLLPAFGAQAGVVLTPLYSFQAASSYDGANPYAGLVQGMDGFPIWYEPPSGYEYKWTGN